ncbi:MAG: UDP-N-acetylmuramoyl-tripeptide--D-alanyl-D-alanine ligase [Proteobacteria bacterium]|nr:UDP-N-acetylmuramoyl-tripeptide--D-alanyl-D-alanine ligase [Pseudomonadota bacterium]
MITFLFVLALLAFTTLRLRTYLQPFQQEEYTARRLLTWWAEKRAFDRWATLGLLIALPFAFMQPLTAPLIAAMWLGLRTYKEPNPTKGGKKPLNLTPRAKKIWLLAILFACCGLAVFMWVTLPAPAQLLLTIAFIQILPVYLAVANWVLMPIQKLQNRRFLKEASIILTRLAPTTIGLTGSFGKTSTKFILNHLLSAHAPTLMTPGSVNTPLGIARVLRENLQPQHTYFLAEMGAYGPGSIARLCKLAPPAISCITAVGEAHYERFKSLETVARAKFEIAEAAHAQGGKCVINIDAIPPEQWKPRVAANPTGYRLVGRTLTDLRPGDTHLTTAEQTAQGLKLTLTHNGEKTSFQTPLFGMHQAGNLAVAFAVAVELGLPKKQLAAAMAQVPAAPHRLTVKTEGGTTIIDDSYNANPTGFTSALEILSLIATSGKTPRRRILVTPGMVELGAKHDEEHTKLGTLAATHADVILALAPQRIPTFVAAATTAGASVIPLPGLAQARQWLAANGVAGDVILIENDLPERYEARWTL